MFADAMQCMGLGLQSYWPDRSNQEGGFETLVGCVKGKFFTVKCFLDAADLEAQLTEWHLEVNALRLRSSALLRQRPRLGAGTVAATIGLQWSRRRPAIPIWLPTTNALTASLSPPVNNARTTHLPTTSAPSSSWSRNSAILSRVQCRQHPCRNRQGAPQTCLCHGLHHQQDARAMARCPAHLRSRRARSRPSTQAWSHLHAGTLVNPKPHPQKRPAHPR